MADNALRLAFILSATDKMSRVIDDAVKKSTDKLSAFERNTSKVGRGMVKGGAMIMGAGAAVGAAVFSAGKSVGDYAGSVKDASESTGVDVESWQKMTYAAKISGIEQEKLMTSMVKFDKLITDAASGSKTAGRVFKDLGISLKDAGGKMRAPEAIFEDVAEIFSKTEDGVSKTALACEFFGKSGAELMPMLNEGKSGLYGLYKAAEDTGNVLSNQTLTAADDFGKSLDAVKFQVKGVMLQLGTALLPVLSEMKDWISDVIGKVGDWIKANPELASTIGKVAAWGSVLLLGLGALSFFFGAILSIVGKVRKAFSGLMTVFSAGKKVIGGIRYAIGAAKVAIAGMRGTTIAANSATRAYMVSQGVATTKTKAYIIGQKLAAAAQWIFNSSLYGCPVIWIVAGIAAVIAAVVLMVKHWDKVSAFFMRLWDGIKKIFAAVWEWIKNMFLNYTPAGLVIKHWDSIKAWFVKLWEGVKNVFRATWEWIKGMFLNYTPHGLIIKHWDSIKAWFAKLWDGVKNVFRAAWEWIKGMFLNYTPHGLVIKHWDSIKAWFSGLWDGIKGVFVGAWNGIKDFFSGLWRRFKQWGHDIIQGLIDGITGMAKKAVDGVKNVGKKIANSFKSFFGINSPSKLFAEYGANITAGLTVGISKGETKAEDATDSLAMRVNRGFEQSMQATTVPASQIANTIGGTSITYAPQITVTGNAAGNIEPDLRKMLKEHERDILDMVERAAANRARLSFI